MAAFQRVGNVNFTFVIPTMSEAQRRNLLLQAAFVPLFKMSRSLARQYLIWLSLRTLRRFLVFFAGKFF